MTKASSQVYRSEYMRLLEVQVFKDRSNLIASHVFS
nr:MAG TPA: hypothetical protein [Caudoviricetes sp.]